MERGWTNREKNGMKKQKQQLPTRRSWKRWAVISGVLVVGIAALWWASGGLNAWGEKPPRLVVDRQVVDLGDLPFETPARVVFTLTNSGEGTLRLAGVPRVEAVKGC
jgi:hypothetical protein